METFVEKSDELRQRQQAREQLEIYCNELSSYLSTCLEQKPELEAECHKDREHLTEIDAMARSDCVTYPVAEYEKECKALQGRIAFYCAKLAIKAQRKRVKNVVFSGIWIDGHMTGMFECHSLKNVRLFKSEYRNGYKNGECTTFYPSGAVKSVQSYKQDVLDGKFTGYHENGQLAEVGTYVKGKQEGYHAVYFDNGQIAKEEVVKGGKRVYAFAFYRSGSIRECNLFTDKGYLQCSVEFTRDGEPYYWGAFREGRYDGKSLLFFHNLFYARVYFDAGKLIRNGEVVSPAEYSLKALEAEYAKTGKLSCKKIHWHPMGTSEFELPQCKQRRVVYNRTSHVVCSVEFSTQFDKVREESGDAVTWLDKDKNAVDLSQREIHRNAICNSAIENGVVKDYSLYGDLLRMKECSYVPVEKVRLTTFYPCARNEVLLNDPGKCRKKSEGTIVNGKKTGHWIYYYNNGMKKREGDVKNGTWENVKEYLNTGKEVH